MISVSAVSILFVSSGIGSFFTSGILFNVSGALSSISFTIIFPAQSSFVSCQISSLRVTSILYVQDVFGANILALYNHASVSSSFVSISLITILTSINHLFAIISMSKLLSESTCVGFIFKFLI